MIVRFLVRPSRVEPCFSTVEEEIHSVILRVGNYRKQIFGIVDFLPRHSSITLRFEDSRRPMNRISGEFRDCISSSCLESDNWPNERCWENAIPETLQRPYINREGGKFEVTRMCFSIPSKPLEEFHFRRFAPVIRNKQQSGVARMDSRRGRKAIREETEGSIRGFVLASEKKWGRKVCRCNDIRNHERGSEYPVV